MNCYKYISSSVVSVQCVENKQLYFAKKLNEAMKVITFVFF